MNIKPASAGGADTADSTMPALAALKLEERGSTDESAEVVLGIQVLGRRVLLSEAVQRLLCFGLVVVQESAKNESTHDGATAWQHEYVLSTQATPALHDAKVRARVQEALASAWTGQGSLDGFSALVTSIDASLRDIEVLRAYGRYLQQVHAAYPAELTAAALVRRPNAAQALVQMFTARFDPALADGRADRESRAEAAFEHACKELGNVEDERIVRRLADLVRATLRTNHFQRGQDGQPKPWMSLKLKSASIEGLPLPRPLVEVFVTAPWMDGIHLRGGKVSRGGIRWSDRPQDFRLEIHNLMKAQRVKNVVIVPDGSKGGFVLTRPPRPAQSRQDAGVEAYRTLMKGLLDITDNLVDGKVVPPAQVVRHDEDDPYLVVAADKGTATFSDIANAVAQDYGFWLGDAFASGGSVGYDHKKMGITAKGAWVSVRQHFQELGIDPEIDEIEVVGVGDMSGDVFGNGMLLSKSICLIGAFDHRHIFLDPDPDPQQSWAERQRLFRMPSSSWNDYSRETLSPGGAIIDRRASHCVVSDAVVQKLGLPSNETDPNTLIRALLRAEVDLLWFGGIGTYVKAVSESDERVGDRANDAVRVDARELRCKVIGEGANLAMTQAARVEFALADGRLNTDAIDNAAGVNCSDHEVNIKVLLAGQVASGKLSLEDRNALLRSMTDDVERLVLRDNELQNQALSLAEARSARLLDRHVRLIHRLERSGELNREVAGLPDGEEIERRMRMGRGLTRPELSVLLAYTKISLAREILASDLPDDPLLQTDLLHYFPEVLQREYSAVIKSHPLRREIVTTCIVNAVVNRVGSGFVNALQELVPCTDADVVRAYIVTRDVFDLEALWRSIEALGSQALHKQVDWMIEVRALVYASCAWLLRHVPCPIDVSALAANLKPAVAQLRVLLPEVLSTEARTQFQRRLASIPGVLPVPMQTQLAQLPLMESAFEIVALADQHRCSVEEAARTYFHVSDVVPIDALRHALARHKPRDLWEQRLQDALGVDLEALHQAVTARRLASLPEKAAALPAFGVEIARAAASELAAGRAPSLAMLAAACLSLRRTLASA